jgi:YD repeat-containing protein
LHGLPWYAGDNPEAFVVRTRKLVTRNLALLHYPIDVSSDATSSVSSDVYTASAVDEMGESFGGESGKAALVSPAAPCVNILQSPIGNQSWRVDCYGDYRQDSQFERFETFTSVPLLVLSRADFSFKGQPFFPFVREYRPQDDRSRPFGIGASNSFDIFPVGDSQTFAWLELILAGGERIHYTRTSIGTGLTNAKFLASRSLGNPFSLSTLHWNGNGWDLATRDGWTYTFPSSGPDRTWQESALIGLNSNSGSKFSLKRNSTNDLLEVHVPGGESLELKYDAAHRITSGTESSGKAMEYEYDGMGRLVHVHDSQTGDEFYEYDPANRLMAVRDGKHRLLLANKYGYLGEIQSQTLADGEKFIYENGYDQDHKLQSLKLILPNGYTILWQLTRNAFIRSWPQLPANDGAVNHP